MELGKLFAGYFFSYLLGSIPFGLLVARLYRIDVRQTGSGNIGTTNVLRVIGKGPAVLTLLGDAGKGMLAVAIGKWLLFPPHHVAGMGLLAIIGHVWPIFLKFKGGKGVATSLGVFLILAPIPMVITLFIWVIIVAIFRYVSLASMVSGVFLPLLIWARYRFGFRFYISLIAGILLIIKHKSNLRRLLAGTENKIGSKKKDDDRLIN